MPTFTETYLKVIKRLLARCKSTKLNPSEVIQQHVVDAEDYGREKESLSWPLLRAATQSTVRLLRIYTPMEIHALISPLHLGETGDT